MKRLRELSRIAIAGTIGCVGRPIANGVGAEIGDDWQGTAAIRLKSVNFWANSHRILECSTWSPAAGVRLLGSLLKKKTESSGQLWAWCRLQSMRIELPSAAWQNSVNK